MRRLLGCLAPTVILMAMSGQASADFVLFTFALTGPVIHGGGTLTATANGDGSYTAVAGTLSVVGDPQSTSGTLLPNPIAPTATLSPSGFFSYDDQLFPGVNPPLNVNGLLFVTPNHEINIWANGPGSYEYFNYNTATQNQLDITNFQFTLTAVPEPGSLTLVGWGVVALAPLAARKRWRRALASASPRPDPMAA